MTEPDGGRRPTLLTTTAVLDGDEWVINGHKWFTSNAPTADFVIVMAVTDPDAEPHRRASMIIVPKRELPASTSCARSARWPNRASTTSIGQPATPKCCTRMSRVPCENLIGEVGEGFAPRPEAARVRAGSTTACAGSG